MAKRFLSSIKFPTLTSDPASGSEGETYYNSSSDSLKIYNGSTWVDVSGSAGSVYVVYSPEPPAAPFVGQIWVEEDLDIAPGIPGSPYDMDGGSPSSTYTVTYDLGNPSSTATEIYDGGTP